MESGVDFKHTQGQQLYYVHEQATRQDYDNTDDAAIIFITLSAS